MLQAKDPLYHRFRQQEKAAARRRIPWLLPYWQWLQIWQDSGHLHERGKHGSQWVMARNGDVGPYSAENVKIVRSETNNEAGARRRRSLAGAEIGAGGYPT